MAGKARLGTGSKKKNHSAVIIIVVVLVVAVVALAGAVIFLLAGRRNAGAEASPADTANPVREVAGSSRLVLDEESASNVMEEMRKEVEEGMFECSMSTEWTFEDGSAESRDAYVANSERNTHPFYFDVVLENTEELIYSSPVLPVGARLTGFKLDKSLPAGEYSAVCRYVLLKDEKSQEELSRANFMITIEIRN